jgi:anti-sigma factor RsiW
MAGRGRRRAVERRDQGTVSHVDDCRKFIQCLSEHFDGELDPELEVEFMMHFEHCERARALVRTFERTIILHRQTRGTKLPEDIHERLLAAIRACQNSEE